MANILIGIINHDALAIKYISSDVTNYDELCSIACARNVMALEFCSEAKRDDTVLVASVVQRNGYCIKFASDRLRSDFDCCLLAVNNSKTAIQYINSEMRNNRDIILSSGPNNSDCMKYFTSDDFLDRQLVLDSLQISGCGLMYATDYHDDDEAVGIAVDSHGLVLKHASSRLKADVSICTRAINQNMDAIKFVDPSIIGSL